MSTEAKIELLKAIIAGWHSQLANGEEFANGYISTKYSRLLDEMDYVVKFLDELDKQ